MKTAVTLLAALFIHGAAAAGAFVQYEQSYDGHIELHNQVQFYTIPIYAGQGDLRIWTDSYSNSANFDPMITLWHNGVRIAFNDDDQTVDPAYQSKRDAGLVLFKLPRGSYVVTISAYPNFPRSARLGDGFAFDSQEPMPIDGWCQPGNPGPGCHSDRHFSLHWSVK
jgi:hypothetical protein